MKQLTLIFALTLLCSMPLPVEGQNRSRKKPPKITAEEAQANVELEWALQSEFEEIRKIDPVRRSVITIPLDNLMRASQIYKVTGEFRRAEAEFMTDATVKGFGRRWNRCPKVS
jgi:hypothetical protein